MNWYLVAVEKARSHMSNNLASDPRLKWLYFDWNFSGNVHQFKIFGSYEIVNLRNEML